MEITEQTIIVLCTLGPLGLLACFVVVVIIRVLCNGGFGPVRNNYAVMNETHIHTHELMVARHEIMVLNAKLRGEHKISRETQTEMMEKV